METPTCRERLAPFCWGNGLDIGFGGEPIVPSAICLDREPEHAHRAAHDAPAPTHLVGDAAHLVWFRDNVLDYVYSSHTLEDFVDTELVLREWLRVLRPGGLLVLFLPDQPTYKAFCESRGALPNQAHKHADFGLEYMRTVLARIGSTEEIHALWPVPNNPYSFDLVVRKL